MTDKLVQVWMNPMLFPEIEHPGLGQLDDAAAIRFLCAPEVEPNLDGIVARYAEISKDTPNLFAAPAVPRILEKLIWPLRHAKSSYMLGNYLGTISLCGMVSEMVTLLIFDMRPPLVNGSQLDDQLQKKLFGSTFEKLGQERRVQVLQAYCVINEPMRNAFDHIRTTRRKYLHLWSQDHETLARDAKLVFDSAITLVMSTLQPSVKGWSLSFPEEVYRYCQKHGITATTSELDDLQQRKESSK